MKFSKELADRIIDLYSNGTNSVNSICEALNISTFIFYRWQKTHKSFGERMATAHDLRTKNIGDVAESAMMLMCKIHEYEEVTTEYTEGKPDANGVVKPKVKSVKKVKKFIMPNPAMVALALTNAKSADYKNRIENDGKLEHTINVVIE